MVNISLCQVKATQIAVMVVSVVLLPALPILALPPTAANDGTGTVVTPRNNTFNITGGTLSSDRSNLFHSFSQFNLEQNQVANFISQPGVNNILGRVVSGNPSVINGLIQVTNGNSNLFLINPAGIIFGQTASLNVPASFAATNATAIGFGNNNWFTVTGNNDYANLNGNPTHLVFASLGGLNGNNVVLSGNQNFPLLANTPADSSQGILGQGDPVVRLSRPGNILSLEINALQFCQQVGGCPNGVVPDNWSLPIVEIPRLLTLGAASPGTGIISPSFPAANLANILGTALPPNPGQPNGLPATNPQNLSSVSLGVALSGNPGGSPSPQVRESGSLSNFISPSLGTSLPSYGGVLPRGDTRLVLENSALSGSVGVSSLAGNRQIINLREPSPSNNLAIMGSSPLGGIREAPSSSGFPTLGNRDGAEMGIPSRGGVSLPRNEPRTDGLPGGMTARDPNNPNSPNEPTNSREQPTQPRNPRMIAPPGVLPSAVGTPGNNLSLAVAARESRLTNQFNNFLGRSLSIPNLGTIAPPPEMNPLEIQEILQNNQAQTNVKSGVVYLTFASPANGTESANDALELVLLTPEGTAVRQTIPSATRSKVLNTALSFRGKITSRNRSSRGFLPEAQQLYQWFIAPLEAQLQATGVNNLILITDDGLRSLPLAALHDGQGFLIERYSITLVPTLTLTDLSYRDIRRSQILAMGASRFTDQDPLPAVPLELQEVISQLQGQSFLNENFTLDNLRRQRQQQPFQIIHLATHAVFAPGDQTNSYIQLWDSRLALDQLKQLRWNDPPVDLLVLSACDTAIGDQQAELGFAGLAIQAGVKSALASLWSVSDEGTLGLMREFYYQLGKAPIKAEALRQAQLAMLRGEVRISEGKLITTHGQVALPPELANLRNVNLNHPYFWSAFTLIGSPW